MLAATRARITAENATTRFSPIPWASLRVSASSAGPMGIMVATRPSIGALREVTRSHSRRCMIHSSRSSLLPPCSACQAARRER